MLSFSFYDPLWISDAHLFDAGEDLASFSYSTLALGGYWSADVTLIQPIRQMVEGLPPEAHGIARCRVLPREVGGHLLNRQQSLQALRL